MIMLGRQEKAEIMGGQDGHGCRASTKHAVQAEKACPGMIRRQEEAEIMGGQDGDHGCCASTKHAVQAEKACLRS
jgi:hypothetical protein